MHELDAITELQQAVAEHAAAVKEIRASVDENRVYSLRVTTLEGVQLVIALTGGGFVVAQF